MSTKPGATTRPVASTTRRALERSTVPIRTIRSPRIATSPESHGLPLPSTMRPFAMTRS
jgi:hypothetical protein